MRIKCIYVLTRGERLCAAGSIPPLYQRARKSVDAFFERRSVINLEYNQRVVCKAFRETENLRSFSSATRDHCNDFVP